MNSPTDTAEPTAPDSPSVPTDAVAALLRGAVEQAREAIVEFSGDNVGEYLGVEFADEAAATHRFLATLAGYKEIGRAHV